MCTIVLAIRVVEDDEERHRRQPASSCGEASHAMTSPLAQPTLRQFHYIEKGWRGRQDSSATARSRQPHVFWHPNEDKQVRIEARLKRASLGGGPSVSTARLFWPRLFCSCSVVIRCKRSRVSARPTENRRRGDEVKVRMDVPHARTVHVAPPIEPPTVHCQITPRQITTVPSATR